MISVLIGLPVPNGAIRPGPGLIGMSWRPCLKADIRSPGRRDCADSLGLHLGLALKKKVVALFGPTPHREIHLYGLGSFLTPKTGLKCLPCLKPRCDKKRQCVERISPQTVAEKIEEEIKYG